MRNVRGSFKSTLLVFSTCSSSLVRVWCVRVLLSLWLCSLWLCSLWLCSLWLCWVGSICWEKNWLRLSFNCHKQLQVKSEAELRSVQNTLNLLNQSLSPTFSRKLGNMKSSEHLVEQLFRVRKQRIMGNVQWDDSVRAQHIVELSFVYT